MSNTISLTVATDDYNALTRASDMLHGLAVDLKKTEGGGPDVKPVQNEPLINIPDTTKVAYYQGKSTTAVDDQLAPEPELPKTYPGSVFAAADLGGSVFAEQPIDPNFAGGAAPLATTVTAPVGSTANPTSAPASATSVELADGIPWDHRIHSSSKNTLAKAPHGWKLKRKPADLDAAQWDAQVSAVEAELRAAMAVPSLAATVPNVTAAPIVAVSAPATPPASPAGPATTPTPPPAVAPAAAPAPAGSIVTMAQLMPAVTAAGITQPQLLAAVQGAGLQSIPLLGARPDLIPSVAAALGLGV